MLLEKVSYSKVNPSKTDKAYIAGIVDGEGSLGITKRLHPHRRSLSPTFTGALQVSMTDEDAIRFIAERYRGRVYRYGRNDGRQPYYVFSATSLELGEIIKDITPYLKVKHPQASIMLEFLDTISLRGKPRTTVPEHITRKRAFCSVELKRLNRKEV